MSKLLSIRDLNVSFGRGPKEVKAVRGVSFDIEAGRTHALVGESGSVVSKSSARSSMLSRIVESGLRISWAKAPTRAANSAYVSARADDDSSADDMVDLPRVPTPISEEGIRPGAAPRRRPPLPGARPYG